MLCVVSQLKAVVLLRLLQLIFLLVKKLGCFFSAAGVFALFFLYSVNSNYCSLVAFELIRFYHIMPALELKRCT